MTNRLPLILGLVVLAVLLAVPPFLKNYGIYLFSYWLVFVIATMGLNLTVGYAGQKSLGHAAFFGIGAYTVAILLKAGISFWLGLPIAMLGCFVIGLALGLSGAARADDLPGVRDAGLQHRGLAGDAQRGVAHRRHLRHQQHRRGRACSASTSTARWPTTTSSSARRSCSARCSGGCCPRPGARPSPRCATTRSAPRAWASTSRPTRCCRLRSARSTPASPARCSRRWSSSSTRHRSPSAASIMMYLMVIVGGAGYFFGPLLGSAVGVLLPEWLRFAQSLVPVRVRRRGGAADAVAARRPAQHPGPAEGAAPCQGSVGGAHRDGIEDRQRAMSSALLEVSGLKKAYGAIKAVDGVSLRGHAGRDLRRHRSQRLGQDDAVQQHPRPDRRPTPARSS